MKKERKQEKIGGKREKQENKERRIGEKRANSEIRRKNEKRG